jgi:hypothetical protein
MMKYLFVAAASIFVAGSWAARIGASFAHERQIVAMERLEHGGGCRKSSPPGQCCHMDNRAGSVHCH